MRRPASEGPADFEHPSLGDEALARQQHMISQFHEMVDALPAACREVREMRCGQDLSMAETARRLGIAPSKVSTRLEPAVKMLKQRPDGRLQFCESSIRADRRRVPSARKPQADHGRLVAGHSLIRREAGRANLSCGQLRRVGGLTARSIKAAAGPLPSLAVDRLLPRER